MSDDLDPAAVEPLDLGAIRERDAEEVSEDGWSYGYQDRRAVLAEVERLRAALTTARRDALTEAAEAIPGSTAHNPVDPYDLAAEWLIERAAQEEDR